MRRCRDEESAGIDESVTQAVSFMIESIAEAH